MTPTQRPRVVVLISGNGSNLQAIIDAVKADLPIQITAVISNRPEAYGLERASLAGIETAVVDHKAYPDRLSYDQALMTLIDHFNPDLLVLAGFMRILTNEFVGHYAGRMLNIHPSLLPKYRGLRTHHQALEAGDKLHGASIHFVTEKLDGGPLIAQAQITVFPEESVDNLAQRVLDKEHQLYPTALRWFAEKRLKLNENGEVILDNRILQHPIIFSPQDPIR
ncbi:MAG: phosphoribosylglycinamide formyltransferase [Candidatus Thiodiazotropha sp. L084R]